MGGSSSLSFVDKTGTVRTAYDDGNISLYWARFPYAIYAGSTVSSQVYFGDGDVVPTMDDYTLSGNIISTVKSLSIETLNVEKDGNYYVCKRRFTFQNTGSSEITIREAGWFAFVYYSSTYSTAALLDRTLLDTPITVPAGGTGQVTYELRVSDGTVSA